MKGFPDLPPLWLALSMVLAWVFARYMPIFASDDPLLPRFGILVAAAGFAFILWAALWFYRKKTTIEPHHEPGALIVEGPYRISRNPIYLGMMMILFGQVIWLGTLSPILLILLLYYILTKRFIEPEEKALLSAFGSEADAYLEATRRWL